MKSSGSVLIVVLGLLAILAVIGIAFITMSNLDRRTATNFAVQSQFILAADGAVDYVCHHLVQDLWTYNTMEQPEESTSVDRHDYYGMDYLLSDHNRPTVLGTENVGLLRNEPFDHPRNEYDPWLASSLGSTASLPDNHFSYGYQTPNRFSDVTNGPYGLSDWGTNTDDQLRPNNVGFPSQDGTVERYTYDIGSAGGRGHGVWIPDLSFPFEAGLIRVSVTVQDHAAMLNLNAHGRPDSAIERHGYYVSDVDPSFLFSPTGGGMPASFFNSGGTVPGLWAEADRPGNRSQLQAVIENPARYHDRPFTLAEEFELRRLTGTHFTSRIEHLVEEQFVGKLLSDPTTATTVPARHRLNVTTVGWTAEVRPSFDRETSEPAQPTFSAGEGYKWRKVDLNFDSYDHIKQALGHIDIFDDEGRRDQFAANICAFRDGRLRTGSDADALLHNYGNRTGASRQPVFRGIKANFIAEQEVDEDDDGDIDYTLQRWEVTVYVYNPWRRLYLHAPNAGLPLEDLSVQMHKGGSVTIDNDFDDIESAAGTQWLPGDQTAKPLSCTIKYRMNHPISPDDRKLSAAIKSISLTYKRTTIDRIDSDYIDQAGNGLNEGDERTLERGIVVESPAGAGDTEETDVLIVYIFLDEPDGGGKPVWFEQGAAPTDTPPAGAVPIRFPRSVKVNIDTNADIPVGGLPPEWVKGISDGGTDGVYTDDVGFRGFPRVGDLNQVLCQFPRPGEEDTQFWPWVPRVAAAAAVEDEKYVKFSWNWKPEGAEGGGGGDTGEVKRLAAANVFTAGGPWLDRIDNDGDAYADYEVPSSGGQTTETFKGRDTGRDFMEGEGGMTTGDSGGRFGGSEIRVAGKINLNTATPETLEALGDSFGISGLRQTVTDLRNAGPIKSPADIINQKRLETGGGSAPTCTQPGKGPVERLDLPFTLISNIATVRSDTYSIYGTVQYIDLQAMHDATTVAARKAAVRQSRRFWALVDRSPCLCYRASSSSVSGFIRPRVLNFQWMD